MADGTVNVELLNSQVASLRYEYNLASADLQLLEDLSAELETNLAQATALGNSLEAAGNLITSIEDQASEGANKFITGAFYCGQEIGSSEQFMNIQTQCETEKEKLNTLYNNVLQKCLNITICLGTAAQAIISCKAYMKSLSNQISYKTSQINAASA